RQQQRSEVRRQQPSRGQRQDARLLLLL
ncbi:hypothetical protein Ahia01_001217500, partial [Argonauta hians]